MCGIAGYISQKQFLNYSYMDVKKKLAKTMYSRGPNQQGSFSFKSSNYLINLFSSRLSILDLDKRSNQPFKNEDTILVFNGEIYNYLEIREELRDKVKFYTNSDTEVVSKAYQVWGEDCVKRFDGMWAFCIFDRQKNKIFLSRDNFGEKPLYFYFDNNNFIFGSETNYLKSIINDSSKLNINFSKVNDYLFKGYRSLNKTNDSFFEKIIKVDSAQNLSLNLKNFNLKKNYYYNKSNLSKKKISKNINENIEITKALVIKSLKRRLRSDVPIAFCLSGGIDSGSLTSLCYKHFNIKPKCYSIIDSDYRYNELENINAIEKDLGIKSKLIKLKKENNLSFLENLKSLINYRNAPLSTVSYYVHSKISQQASKDGFKVIMSGTGADEIFSGYYDHSLLFLNEIKDKKKFKSEVLSWKKNTKSLIRNEKLQNINLFIKDKKFRDHLYFDQNFISNILRKKIRYKFEEKKYSNNLMSNRLSNELLHETVPAMLDDDDMNSMQFSIENRSPFLSRELANYSMSINNEHRIKNGLSKFILREAMKGILVNKVRLTKRKKGFNASLSTMLKLDYKYILNFLSENDYLKKTIDFNKLSSFFDKNHLSNEMNKMLFSLINVKIFLDK
jgi:asparagine synthase (glutamine-hydrolysing)